jgi:hypothetical protein
MSPHSGRNWQLIDPYSCHWRIKKENGEKEDIFLFSHKANLSRHCCQDMTSQMAKNQT